MNAHAVTPIQVETLQRIFERSSNQWTGCHWVTALGSTRMNLQAIRARQARWMAEATSGEESSAWNDATMFLMEIESDAKRARLFAERAIESASDGHWETAIAQAERAMLLEVKYREPIAWKPLYDALRQ